jgi:hypothetical protein
LHPGRGFAKKLAKGTISLDVVEKHVADHFDKHIF